MRGCGVSYAASCLLRTNVRASVGVTIMVCSVFHRILTAPGLNFVQKRSSFTPRHERPRYDPSSGGGRRPFPTNPTSTTSHLVRRLTSPSRLLKSSSCLLPYFTPMVDALRSQITPTIRSDAYLLVFRFPDEKVPSYSIDKMWLPCFTLDLVWNRHFMAYYPWTL